MATTVNGAQRAVQASQTPPADAAAGKITNDFDAYRTWAVGPGGKRAGSAPTEADNLRKMMLDAGISAGEADGGAQTRELLLRILYLQNGGKGGIDPQAASQMIENVKAAMAKDPEGFKEKFWDATSSRFGAGYRPGGKPANDATPAANTPANTGTTAPAGGTQPTATQPAPAASTSVAEPKIPTDAQIDEALTEGVKKFLLALSADGKSITPEKLTEGLKALGIDATPDILAALKAGDAQKLITTVQTALEQKVLTDPKLQSALLALISGKPADAQLSAEDMQKAVDQAKANPALVKAASAQLILSVLAAVAGQSNPGQAPK